MSANYKSFLICIHPTQADVWREGLPVGVIREGKFICHSRELPDGRRVDVPVDYDAVNEAIELLKLIKP